jgi:hypothetical protein
MKFWAAESRQKWGSIKGDVKKKHFPFRKGESVFSDIELPPKVAR